MTKILTVSPKILTVSPKILIISPGNPVLKKYQNFNRMFLAKPSVQVVRMLGVPLASVHHMISTVNRYLQNKDSIQSAPLLLKPRSNETPSAFLQNFVQNFDSFVQNFDSFVQNFDSFGQNFVSVGFLTTIFLGGQKWLIFLCIFFPSRFRCFSEFVGCVF